MWSIVGWVCLFEFFFPFLYSQVRLIGSFLPFRLFSHVGDPFLDDPLPREYVLYLRPTGPLAQKLSDFWQQSKQICGKNKAHNIFPHITLCQFFMVSYNLPSSDLGSLVPCIPSQHSGSRSQSLTACRNQAEIVVGSYSWMGLQGVSEAHGYSPSTSL